jgi:hypothetical protein
MTKRILWVNTVGWSAYDRPVADLLRTIKEPGTEVIVIGADEAGRRAA